MNFESLNDNYIKDIIDQSAKEALTEVKDECVQLYKDAIQNSVYDYYLPSQDGYDRTMQLIKNTESEITDNNELIVYSNGDAMDYFSVYGEDITGNDVLKFVENGHHQENALVDNEFTNFESRDFLEDAKERIDSSLGIDSEVIKDWQ